MDTFILRLYGWSDALPYALLKKIQYFFMFAYISFGLACLVYFAQPKEQNFATFGAVAIAYVFVVLFAHNFLLFVWALWLHMTVFLIMLGAVLKEAGGTILGLGIVSGMFLCIRFCTGFETFVFQIPHSSKPATELV